MTTSVTNSLEHTPLISVIIPVYNGEDFIGEALETVFEQTYQNLEVIVVNDGSSDSSYEMLEPYLSRIQYICKQNGGIASAYNAGAQVCHGKYICFLEQDDLWIKDKIEKQLSYLAEHPNVDMVFCRYFMVNETETNGEHKLSKLWPSEISYEELFVNTLEHASMITFSAVMMRKCLFDKILPFDQRLRISVDYDAWLKATYKSNIGFMAEPLLRYRIHDSNTSAAPLYALQDDLMVLCKWKSDAKAIALLGKWKVNQRIWTAHDALRYCYTQENDVTGERRCLLQMIKLRPSKFNTIGRFFMTFISHKYRKQISWYLKKAKDCFSHL